MNVSLPTVSHSPINTTVCVSDRKKDAQLNKINSSYKKSCIGAVAVGAILCAACFYCRSSESQLTKGVAWLVQVRGGLAWLSGLLLVPSQFSCPGDTDSQSLIDQASKTNQIASFEINAQDGVSLKGIIYDGKPTWPSWWFKDYQFPEHFDRCIVYHNPNGVVSSQIISRENMDLAILLQDISKCPVIMYDYRGTGLNAKAKIDGVWNIPTAASIIEDGVMITEYAANKCDRVDIFGSSLGGGVGTISLDQYLQKHPQERSKFRLYNHDSFTTTPRVMFPSFGKLADTIGNGFGGLLDAEASLKNLMKQNITITILYSTNDPVIPAGARLGETITESDFVRLIKTQTPDHASLGYYYQDLNDLKPPFQLRNMNLS